MKKKVLFTSIVVTLLVLVGCGNTNEATKSKENVEESVLDWSYKGEKGPDNWEKLNKKYKLKSTKEQSPIDISKEAKVEALASEAIHFQPGYFELLRQDQQLTLTPMPVEGKENILTFNEEDYLLTAINLHVPSEHKIQGKQYDGELQLKFESKEKKNLIMAVMLEEGEKNYALDQVSNEMTKLKNNKKVTTKEPISTLALIPQEREYIAYQGSFTAPPTTEGVQWLVMKKAITLEKSQLKELTKVLKDNVRPIQKQKAN